MFNSELAETFGRHLKCPITPHHPQEAVKENCWGQSLNKCIQTIESLKDFFDYLRCYIHIPILTLK